MNEWSYAIGGTELRVMRLPDRNNLYLILVDEETGMHAVARTLGDREAVALVAFLDRATGELRPESDSAGAEGLRVGHEWGRRLLGAPEGNQERE